MESSARDVRVGRMSETAEAPKVRLPEFLAGLTTSWLEVVGRTNRPGFKRAECSVIEVAANRSI